MMEPPTAPLSAATITTQQPPPLGYPDSLDSSPRSWDDSQYQPSPKLRLMCSYGGHIVPRPHSKSLCYVGGDTRIIVVDRQTNFADLTNRLAKTLFSGRPFSLKYQLPNEDLDSLISITTDEDLENMIEEYDRLNSANNKSSRLRLFLFPIKHDSGSSIGSLLENSEKSDDWFLNALNGTTSGFSDTASINRLLGLDDDGEKKQDVHAVPDSPMVDTTSSFGSANSALANLPPIRVHVVEDHGQKVGIEEQFGQMSVVENVVQVKQDVGGFPAVSSPPLVPPPLVAISSMPPPFQQNFPSPDSVSSDGSITNPLSKQKPMFYPEQIPQIPQISQIQSGNIRPSPNSVDPKIADPNPNPTIIQQQQLQDSSFMLQPQFDPHHHYQQFIHPGAQYIHQQHPTGAMQMPSYYPVYPSHHPHQAAHDQQYPVYYIPARQPQVQPPTAMPRNPEMASSLYRAATAAAPSMVQVPSTQPQYVNFAQFHHPSQSIAPNSAATPNYAYEYYAQTMAPPQMAAQYQTTQSVVPEGTTHIPAENGRNAQP